MQQDTGDGNRGDQEISPLAGEFDHRGQAWATVIHEICLAASIAAGGDSQLLIASDPRRRTAMATAKPTTTPAMNRMSPIGNSNSVKCPRSCIMSPIPDYEKVPTSDGIALAIMPFRPGE